ncbi:purine and uridine phosphorylase [Ascobolus immersus RN42]|uniref:Purine and uridine phosphorylase n=1 Tax=Ascobolus immersus RN42 TaxID=1160509 RepID=A0A3N4HPN9_ASCIM|nr:purine and uridine phosphorylase [Ascobolus immersus RN42]
MPSKRVKVSPYDNDAYTVGWISAISCERTAAELMLDRLHGMPKSVHTSDRNVYRLGEINGHKIAIAVLPDGDYGTHQAATVAAHMQMSFTNLRFGLMVGVGGGIPDHPDFDVRLGDVVVSTSTGTTGGVIQYDRGKRILGKLVRTGQLNSPPPILKNAIGSLKACSTLRVETLYTETIQKHPLFRNFQTKLNGNQKGRFSHQSSEHDILYKDYYEHKEELPRGQPCSSCEPEHRVERERRDGEDPVVHYGIIASGNTLVKDASFRKELREQFDAICAETEAAGLMNNFPCVVIRGICDYCDSHKNKRWQQYAALTAAAYARELLYEIIAADVERVARIEIDRGTLQKLHRKISSIWNGSNMRMPYDAEQSEWDESDQHSSRQPEKSSLDAPHRRRNRIEPKPHRTTTIDQILEASSMSESSEYEQERFHKPLWRDRRSVKRPTAQSGVDELENPSNLSQYFSESTYKNSANNSQSSIDSSSRTSRKIPNNGREGGESLTQILKSRPKPNFGKQTGAKLSIDREKSNNFSRANTPDNLEMQESEYTSDTSPTDFIGSQQTNPMPVAGSTAASIKSPVLDFYRVSTEEPVSERKEHHGGINVAPIGNSVSDTSASGEAGGANSCVELAGKESFQQGSLVDELTTEADHGFSHGQHSNIPLTPPASDDGSEMFLPIQKAPISPALSPLEEPVSRQITLRTRGSNPSAQQYIAKPSISLHSLSTPPLSEDTPIESKATSLTTIDRKDQMHYPKPALDLSGEKNKKGPWKQYLPSLRNINVRAVGFPAMKSNISTEIWLSASGILDEIIFATSDSLTKSRTFFDLNVITTDQEDATHLTIQANKKWSEEAQLVDLQLLSTQMPKIPLPKLSYQAIERYNIEGELEVLLRLDESLYNSPTGNEELRFTGIWVGDCMENGGAKPSPTFYLFKQLNPTKLRIYRLSGTGPFSQEEDIFRLALPAPLALYGKESEPLTARVEVRETSSGKFRNELMGVQLSSCSNFRLGEHSFVRLDFMHCT